MNNIFLKLFCVYLLTNLSNQVMYSQNETINLLDKNLIFGSSEKQTLEIFSGFSRTTESAEPKYVTVFSQTYINKFYGGEIPLIIDFVFFNDKLFKIELEEFYTADGPDPNLHKYKRISLSLDGIMAQLDKLYEKDTLGIKLTYFEKNNLSAVHYSMDQGKFICFDMEILSQIRQEHSDYEMKILPFFEN